MLFRVVEGVKWRGGDHGGGRIEHEQRQGMIVRERLLVAHTTCMTLTSARWLEKKYSTRVYRARPVDVAAVSGDSKSETASFNETDPTAKLLLRTKHEGTGRVCSDDSLLLFHHLGHVRVFGREDERHRQLLLLLWGALPLLPRSGTGNQQVSQPAVGPGGEDEVRSVAVQQ